MALKDFSDTQLKKFIEDPHSFIKDKENFVKAFGLDDPQFHEKILQLQSELGSQQQK